jgi:hypothetical protein
MEQITLEKVANKVLDFFKSHGEVVTVTYGDQSVFEGSTDTLYPLAYIEADTSTMSTGSDVYTLAISVWDRPKDDLSDLLAIQSKTRMILSDLRVEFVRGANPFVLPDDDIAITPMKHVKNDRVTGWMLSIDFDAKGFADRCNIPQR